MSTRSYIAMKTENGFKAVYAHWDGYPSHNGRILLHHYSDKEKLSRLLDLGDISSLGENIGERHDFDWWRNLSPEEMKSHPVNVNNWTTFYGRDRGETGVEAKEFNSLPELIEFAKNSWADYLYVFDTGQWMYTGLHNHMDVYGDLLPLTEEAIEEN